MRVQTVTPPQVTAPSALPRADPWAPMTVGAATEVTEAL